MDYDEIEQLRTQHSAWRLLASPHAPLILSFLGRVFIDANASNLPGRRLIDELDDELFAVNQRHADGTDGPRFPARPNSISTSGRRPTRGGSAASTRPTPTRPITI
ncbi:MAG: DUF3375 family protein [Acidimicrobiales bacterium]